MQIPLVNLKKQQKIIRSSVLKNIINVIQSGQFILGDQLNKFETEFASYVGSKYCIGVNSGTDALLFALIALGIKKNDEIIVPAMSFIATVEPIIQIEAKPVFVDIEKNGYLIDAKKIEENITKKTKAIIPVHLYGLVCDMTEIKKIAKKHHLAIIEDACQAHGSFYGKKKAGSFGDVGIFSFYPSKNLGAYGDGGAIVTSNKSMAIKIATLRNHGQKRKYEHLINGYNSRLDDLQAAILRVKLKLLDKWNEKRRRIAKQYNFGLRDLPVLTPVLKKDNYSNFHIYNIQYKKRNSLLKYLEKNNIYCGIHYPIPLHLQPSLKILGYKKGSFPNAEKLSNECMSLPIYPELSKKEVLKVVKTIKKFFKKDSGILN